MNQRVAFDDSRGSGVSSVRARPNRKLRPGLERLEPKRPLSASLSTTRVLHATASSGTLATHPAESIPAAGLVLYRITNPTPTNALLMPPFRHVFVQATPPSPARSTTCSPQREERHGADFRCKQRLRRESHRSIASLPVLTGTEQWKPGQATVFTF